MASRSRKAIAKLNFLSSYDTDPEKRQQYKECINVLLKDLEVLEIITKNKNLIDVCYGASGNKIIVETYQFSVSAMQQEEFNEVKEWLENE